MSDEEEQERVCEPCWEFSLWDIAGIGMIAVSGTLGALAHASSLLSLHFAAAANHSRQARQLREAQRYNEALRKQMAADLENLMTPGEPS